VVTSLWQILVVLAVVMSARPVLAETGIGEIWRQTHWGESSDALLGQFGSEAMRLPRALDFGDSYADIVLPDQVIGGVPMVVFFQMDKVSHGLKRIQFERPRHGVNPPAFRGLLDPRTSGERVASRRRSVVASGQCRRQYDLSRHDPPSLRGLPVRPGDRLLRASRPVAGADRPAWG